MVRKSDTAGEGHEFCALSHGPTVIPRSTMSSILAGMLDLSRCKLHLRRRLTHYEEVAAPDGRTTIFLNFEDGTRAECDLLVGADGIFSRVRRELFEGQPEFAQHHFSGQLAYRMSCSPDALRRLHATKPDHAALRGLTIVSERVGKEYLVCVSADEPRRNSGQAGASMLHRTWLATKSR